MPTKIYDHELVAEIETKNPGDECRGSVMAPSLRIAAALARALGIDTALADPVVEKTGNERPHATH